MSTAPGSRAEGGFVRFVPPLLWMGVIALGSTDLLAGERTGRFMLELLGPLVPSASPDTLAIAHLGVRKLGHLVEYGILAILWHGALAPSPSAVRTALLVAAAY